MKTTTKTFLLSWIFLISCVDEDETTDGYVPQSPFQCHIDAEHCFGPSHPDYDRSAACDACASTCTDAGGACALADSTRYSEGGSACTFAHQWCVEVQGFWDDRMSIWGVCSGCVNACSVTYADGEDRPDYAKECLGYADEALKNG